jgi:dolichyl-phosphate-mannose-protein mannosyltransferase
MSAIYNADLVGLKAWVAKNSNWLALGIVAAGFVMRVAYASSCYLNPDEAIHFEAARPSSWFETYQASLEHAHPPLLILVLHGILFLGRTELILRLPSVVGGTGALWFTFAWLRRSLGETLALAGLIFMTLSPAAISASTEVRQYGLLLCFVCSALYATERALTGRSTIWAIVQGFCLLGAVLTHYTAIVVLLSLGLYILVRTFLDGVSRRILFTIGVCHLVLATLVCWQFFEHVHGVTLFDPSASMDYLRKYYAQGGETPLGFVWRSLWGTFSYAVGAHRLALPFMFVFMVGLIALLTRRTKAPSAMAVLLISPFIAGIAASVLQVFPFAGSRHQTYLLPFLAAGISAGFACFQRVRTMPLLLLGAVITPLWVARASAPDNNPRTMPIGDMTAAIEYIARMVPQGSPLFVDNETREVLRYYLTRNDRSLDTLPSFHAEVEESLGNYRDVVPRNVRWAFRPDDALEQVTQSARALGLPPSDPLWVVSAAWLDPSLASRLPAGGNRDVKEFGRISVIRVLAQSHLN